MKPANQHQQVLYYLNLFDYAFSLKEVINDSMFYKFQSRLGEIEDVHGKICNRTRIKFTNQFGNKSSYTEYVRCVTKDRLKELFNLYK